MQKSDPYLEYFTWRPSIKHYLLAEKLAMWLFSRKPTPPPIVPTDLIIPFNYWDDDNTLRGLSFDVTFRFDDVLDSDKLRRALSRLLEIGNWRKHECKLSPKNLSG